MEAGSKGRRLARSRHAEHAGCAHNWSRETAMAREATRGMAQTQPCRDGWWRAQEERRDPEKMSGGASVTSGPVGPDPSTLG